MTASSYTLVITLLYKIQNTSPYSYILVIFHSIHYSNIFHSRHYSIILNTSYFSIRIDFSYYSNLLHTSCIFIMLGTFHNCIRFCDMRGQKYRSDLEAPTWYPQGVHCSVYCIVCTMYWILCSVYCAVCTL